MWLEPPQSSLDWDQVDGILRYLDSLESVIHPSSEDVSANIQNFGVFSLAQGPCPTLSGHLGATAPGMPKALQPDSGYELPFELGSMLMDSDPSHGSSKAEAAWNLCNLHGGDLSLATPPHRELAPSTIPLAPGLVPNHPIPLGHAALSAPRGFGGLMPSEGANSNLCSKTGPEPTFPSPPNGLESLAVPSQERLLMGHYRNRVVNLFCVIDNAKSPWKTIHLPRVLQCAGELSFGGTTTRIRDALRKTLLSISAFYLCNDQRARHRTDEAENWGTIASQYRCDAIGLLKYAVETDLYADKKPKYKEFLATMLSMVTINVS